MADVQQRALAYFAEQNGLEVSDLECQLSEGDEGVMVFVARRGDEQLIPGIRYYFPHVSDEMFRVPGYVSSARRFEKIIPADSAAREAARIR